MDDRTMLELAAKAAGLAGDLFYSALHDTFFYVAKYDNGTDCQKDAEWNPLQDDGDALRLAVKLGLSLTPYPIYNLDRHSVIVKQRRLSDTLREPNPTEVVQTYDGDPYAATRRAITRAAAEIELSREKQNG